MFLCLYIKPRKKKQKKQKGNHCLHLHVVISGNMHTCAWLSEAHNISNHSEISSVSVISIKVVFSDCHLSGS